MRKRYIVTYDICEPRRLRRVFRVMKGYGHHLQLSVFRCDLNAMGLASMKAALASEICYAEDQVLIVDVGPSEGRGEDVFESIGRAYVEGECGPTVV